MIKLIPVYILSYLTIFSIFFYHLGNNVFDFSLMYGLAAYCLCSIQFTSFLYTPIPNDKDWESETDLIINPELNHTNLKIREHYRNLKLDQSLVGHYLVITFFPVFIIIFLLQKIKYIEYILDFFGNNQIVEFYYKNRKKIIEEKNIIEDNKEYQVSIFSDGREEYRYKGKLHRENGAAINYSNDLSDFKALLYSKFYIDGVEIKEFELKKNVKSYKLKHF